MSNSRIFLLAFVVMCFVAACKSDPQYDPNQQLTIDDDSIARYVDHNHIDVTKSQKGLYYHIIDPGADTARITLKHQLIIHYVGRIMGTQQVLDSTATNIDSLSTKFILADVIQGWQLGIPKVKQGGHIRLIVASPLAYQNRQLDKSSTTSAQVLSNSILDFDIRVIKVIDPSKITTTVTN